MSERFVIPIAEHRYQALPARIPEQSAPPTGLLQDSLSRRLHDVRVSITDRCNFRCGYCMPRSVFDKDYAFLPQSSLLSFEEIVRLVRAFIAHGTEKIRLTGGEPLLRKDVDRLIGMLAELRTRSGQPLDLTLTTNASLLARKARSLRDAGLSRITVSLDALDETTFRSMNDADFPVSDVLEGIAAAQAAGFKDIKINMVVQRDRNDHDILPMARHFRHSGQILRFIEFMDVGSSNGWQMSQVLPSAQVRDRIHAEFPLESLQPNYPGEVAERWRYRDGAGEVGFISSVTQPFCGDCSRARVSTEGRLYTCLFASQGHDLRGLLRTGASELQLAAAIADIWSQRDDRYSVLRSNQTTGLRKIEMSYIGG
ncbi:MAG: 3,8-cyclase MoaA [Pseudomonadota bacterium]|jgi:cyclic pyranopterin phosphate synthase